MLVRRCFWRTGSALSAALFGASAAAAAQPIYYNKAEVTRDQYAADYGECDGLAGGVARPHYFVVSPNIAVAAAGSFFAAFLGGAEQRGMMRAVLRTCMADKGYRRIRMSEGSEARVRKLKEQDKDEAMYQLASGLEIEGELLTP